MFEWINQLFLCPFSIAMLNYQRGTCSFGIRGPIFSPFGRPRDGHRQVSPWPSETCRGPESNWCQSRDPGKTKWLGDHEMIFRSDHQLMQKDTGCILLVVFCERMVASLPEYPIYIHNHPSIIIHIYIYIYITGWWFGTFYIFQSYWECHHPN